MPFRPEPAHTHGRPSRTGLLLVNLGSPDAPTKAALRRYLGEFLGDPRVVEIPRWIWSLVLHGIILNTRPAKSAAKYASIWLKEGSPLAVHTARVAERLRAHLASVPGVESAPVVRHDMRYGNPSVASVLDEMKAEGCDRILVLPLYPQYAAATTASVFDAVGAWARQTRHVPELRFVNRYGDDPSLVDALAASVRRHWTMHGRGEVLVMSFHGLPERSLFLGDPYHCECHKAARLLAQALDLNEGSWRTTFQSRFGKAQWLRPYTEPTLKELAAAGVRRVDVICPGFAVDCLETLEEIAQEASEAFVEAGGQAFQYIPCLNDDDAAIQALAGVALGHMRGWVDAAPADDGARQRQRERALSMGARD